MDNKNFDIKTLSKEKKVGGKYLTFSLGTEEYGIEILKVVEIIGYMNITEIPQTPKFILGIINLRDKIIPIMDLRSRFNIEMKEIDEETVIIVLQTENAFMGILVDRVIEVINIPAENIEDSPNFGVDIKTDYILGMGKTGKKVTILLSIDKVLTDDIKDMVSTVENMGELV